MAGELSEHQDADQERLLREIKIDTDRPDRIVVDNVVRSITQAAGQVSNFREYFAPLTDGKETGIPPHRAKEIQKVVDLLKVDDAPNPEDEIKELVILSTYSEKPETYTDMAAKVGERIEKVAVAIKSGVESPDAPFYPTFEPALNDQEKETRSVLFAGILKASRLLHPGRGGDEYAPLVVVAYKEAVKITDFFSKSSGVAEKFPSVVQEIKSKMMPYLR